MPSGAPSARQPPCLCDETLREIFDHARAAYPDECCGFVLASGKVIRCCNEQGLLLALESPCHHGTNREGFSFSAGDVILLYESFESADPARIVYHSHADADAHPSSSDLRGLALSGLLKPARVDYLIVACHGVEQCSAALYSGTESGLTLSQFWADERPDPEWSRAWNRR